MGSKLRFQRVPFVEVWSRALDKSTCMSRPACRGNISFQMILVLLVGSTLSLLIPQSKISAKKSVYVSSTAPPWVEEEDDDEIQRSPSTLPEIHRLTSLSVCQEDTFLSLERLLSKSATFLSLQCLAGHVTMPSAPTMCRNHLMYKSFILLSPKAKT
ncbi:hypothetical protein GBAR_LOCUS18778 [Geodia barretti]|uniref:Uncharacterized protein n=1 Tax=Geodia barretti TaxID=519541 RepID=A0AA35WUH9_GEOBA|nr:hypothetical protein GBAR_LOCUS18778 [Geodia barretti]